MTEIAFHVNAADKLGYACRLLRKAWGAGSRVAVTGDPALLRDLDISLWTFSALDFVPHCYDAPAAVRTRTPVVLVDSARDAPQLDVLVNLGAGVPEGFERFQRLIEVVGADQDDLQQGRQRWRHYKGRGYAVTQHDLAGAR